MKLSNGIGVVTDELQLTWRLGTWKKADLDRNLMDEDDYVKMVKIYKEELSNLAPKKIKGFHIKISNVVENKGESGNGKTKVKGKANDRRASGSKVRLDTRL